MKNINMRRVLNPALAFAAIVSFVSLAPAASAAAANNMLLCISDTDFGCFGSSAGNSVSLGSSGGTLSTSTNGDGTVLTDFSNGNTLSAAASLGVFSLSITTGTYNPSPNTAMDLNSLTISSSGPGNLFLVFGADNYAGTGPFSEVGSVTLNSGVTSATDTACYEGGNGSFDICGGPFSPNIGSATTTSTGALDFSSSVLAPSSPFGLEEDVEVAFSSAGTFSGDLSLVTPEPTSLLLLGTFLAVAGGFLKKRLYSA